MFMYIYVYIYIYIYTCITFAESLGARDPPAGALVKKIQYVIVVVVVVFGYMYIPGYIL